MSFPSTFRATLWGILFAYISLIPFYYLQPVGYALNTTTITLFKYLPLILILIIFIATFLPRNVPSSLHHHPPVIVTFAIGFYLLIVFISLVGSDYPKEGFLKAIYYTLTGPLILYLRLPRNDATQGRISGLFSVFVLIAALVAFYGILVFIAKNDFLWGAIYRQYNPYFSGTSRVSSSLGNAVFAGAYFALCYPLSLSAAIHETRPNWKTGYGICTGLILLALFLTFTRGAWISAALATAIYVWPKRNTLIHHARTHLSVHRLVIALIFLLTLTAVLEGIGFGQPMSQAWHLFWSRTDHLTDPTNTESFRLAQYTTTLNVLKDHPFLGLGFGTFTRQFQLYKSANTPAGYIANTTENFYLMVACETGIIGLIAFLFLLTLLLRAIHRTKHNTQHPAQRDLCLSCLSALSGFLFDMATWDALNQPTLRRTFWIITALCL